MNEWTNIPPPKKDLMEMVRRAKTIYDAMTPEQKALHDKAQRDSFVRGMMPTGDPRFD